MSREEAIEAGGRALYEDAWLPELWPAWEALQEKRREEYRHRFTVCLDAAAPHLVVHVHHHDTEKHAEHFNEGYEAAMAQHLADDPTVAEKWLSAEKAEAVRKAARAWQVNGWADDLPGGTDRITLILGMAQRATNFLYAYADRMEAGEQP